MNHVRIGKNKIKRFCLAALLFYAFGCILAGAFLSGAPNVAHAAQNLDSETNASLFLPESYENYLKLSAPSSVAIGERYVAVADGKKIYIYDHMDPSKGYRVWEHSRGAETVTVGKMQFTDEDRLYFSSVSGLFELSLENELSEKQVSNNFYPYTFLIAENILYVVTVNDGSDTVLYRFEMSRELLSLTDAKQHVTISKSSSEKSSPLLAYSDGTVYCSLNGSVYHYNGETLEGNGNFPLDNTVSSTLTPSSVCAIEDSLYFTDGAGLHRADTNGNAKLIESAEDIKALYPHGDLLYCLCGNAVRAYDTKKNVFTDYEISSDSASVGRLSGATDIVRAESLVVVADTANHRVSVYNSDTGNYSVLKASGDFSPTLVATDGTLVAAVSGGNVYVCQNPMRDPTFGDPFSPNSGVIEGIACVFGKVYYVTQNNIQGVLGGESASKSNGGSPTAMTSDLYGNLYVAYNDASVRSFSEEQFIAQDENGTVLEGVTVPAEAKTLRTGFDGSLYYLDKDGKLCGTNGEQLATINGANFVYSEESSLSPVSFALGFEDDCVYFNFGNFIVASKEGSLGFPTLKTIGTADVYGELSLVHAPEDVRYVDVKKGAVGIKVDLSTLTGDTPYFPYDSYARTAEKDRGVMLAETDKYGLIALYHDRGYDVRLFRKEECADASAVIDEAAGQKYLSSPCNLYNFPCIAEAFQQTLPRGTLLTVLNVVQADGDKDALPDYGYDFAYVEVVTPARETVRGYVPLSFLTDADPSGGAEEDFELVKLKEDAVFTDGTHSKTLPVGTEVRVRANGDGTYSARYSDGEGTYSAVLAEGMIDRGQSDALRIALIVILSVLALVIIGAYFALLPRMKDPENP